MPIYLFRGKALRPAGRRLRLLTEFNKTAWSIEVHCRVGRPKGDPLGPEPVALYQVIGLLAIRRREPRCLSLDAVRQMVDEAAKRDYCAAFEEAAR